MSKIILTLIGFICFASITFSQCTITSSTGYTVTVSLVAQSVNAPNSCPNGYSYTINVQYNIVFSGNNIPGNLYTLQGYLACGNTSSYFNLPNNGGSGVSQTSNAYTPMTNCATVTPSALNCNSVNLQIEGLGIPSQFINCPLGSPLPVELIEFKGSLINNREVNLNWSTSSEKNNDFFAIERSADGIYWEKLSSITGIGNSNIKTNYQYIDEKPLQNKVFYYRLKQVDFDGNFEHSNIISINRTNSGNSSIFLYPNPAKNLVTIEGDHELIDEIEIFSVDGKRITDFFMSNIGNNTVTLEISNLPTGTYLVRANHTTLRFSKE